MDQATMTAAAAAKSGSAALACGGASIVYTRISNAKQYSYICDNISNRWPRARGTVSLYLAVGDVGGQQRE